MNKIFLLLIFFAVLIISGCVQDGETEDTGNLKCAELNGYLCEENSQCLGELAAASDGVCCSQECYRLIEEKTCSELGGKICSDASACKGSLLEAADTNLCCSQKCEKPLPTCA